MDKIPTIGGARGIFEIFVPGIFLLLNIVATLYEFPFVEDESRARIVTISKNRPVRVRSHLHRRNLLDDGVDMAIGLGVDATFGLQSGRASSTLESCWCKRLSMKLSEQIYSGMCQLYSWWLLCCGT
jgi:hypothetical protein